MAEYGVSPAQLRSCASQLRNVRREMNNVAFKLGAMQLGSAIQIKASTFLIGKVADCKWAVGNQADNWNDLLNGLDEIAEIYDRTENELKEPKTQAQADAQNDQNGDNWMDQIPQWLADYIMPVIGIWGDSVDQLLELLNSGGSAVCTFLSLVTSMYSNAVEFEGDLSNPRFWLETVGEVAADVAIGSIAAIVAAAVGLTGGTAAVAVVVSVVVAKVVVGLINGESVSETISDGFIDIGEELGRIISSI